MVSKDRIDQISQFCNQCLENFQVAEKFRDDLIKQQTEGMMIFQSDSEGYMMPILIQEAEQAAKIYKNCLTQLESLRDRAIAGEDV